MADRDKIYLLKELTRTIDESDSTAAFCLCQRWILKDAHSLIKDQESVIEALKSDLAETLEVLAQKPEIVLCKDCKHFNDMKCSYPERGTCNLWHMLHWGEWFCASGERKDNG